LTTVIGDTRDGVAARLRRLVIGTFLLLLLVGASGVVAIEIATNQNSKLTGGYSPADSAHQRTLTLMLDSETAVRGYLLTGNQSFLAPYRASRSQVLPDLART
jgi:CHASE3 domain sensor protein